jgi:hypothetical protein
METLKPHIEIDREKLETFCRKWKITELALFGSVLRDDFRPDSDVDVLVTFAPDADVSLWDVLDAEEELKQMLGRDVDLVLRTTVERSRNYIRRRNILSSARPFYVAR